MQESKYCEDIVPKLKYSLENMGYTNEHDRLGHFESKVPVDVLFGLAKKYSTVKIFGIQFKAPQKIKSGVSWNLAHTPGQYELIMTAWCDFLIYCLPWYLDLADSQNCVDLSAFLLPSVLPKKHVEYVTEIKPLSKELTARFLSFIVTGSTSSEDLVNAFMDNELEEVLDAIIHYPKYYLTYSESMHGEWNKEKHLEDISDAEKRLQDLGVNLHSLVNAKNIFKYCSMNFIRERPIKKLEPTYITQWKSKMYRDPSSFSSYLGSVRLHKEDDTKRLTYKSSMRVKFTCNSSKTTDEIDRIETKTEFLSWDDIIDLISEGEIGVSLTDIDVDEFKSKYKRLFNLDENDLIVWYDHIEKIYYAIETKRLLIRDGEVLTNLVDPLCVRLDPEIRRKIYKIAKERGVTASELLVDIVRKYINKNENMKERK